MYLSPFVKVLVAIALGLIRMPALAEEPDLPAQLIGENHTYLSSGFECANETLSILPLLGRGNDFPQFLLTDVENELIRQVPESKLVSANCTAPPEVQASTLASESGELKDSPKVLSKLKVIFYLDLVVHTGVSELPLTIEHVYFAENLDTIEKRKLTQKFVVMVQEPEQL
jgi:hypothetical protein